MRKLTPLVSLVFLLALSACSAAQTVETDQYSLALPQGVSCEEEADGLRFLGSDGAAWGGLEVIPWENADQLGFRDPGAVEEDDLSGLTDALLEEGEVLVAESYSSSLSSDFLLNLTTDRRQEELHYFYCQENQLYDLWFSADGLSQEDAEAVAASFSLRS